MCTRMPIGTGTSGARRVASFVCDVARAARSHLRDCATNSSWCRHRDRARVSELPVLPVLMQLERHSHARPGGGQTGQPAVPKTVELS